MCLRHRKSQNITYSAYYFKYFKAQQKNPAYGRQSISRPMRIEAQIPQQGGPRIPKNPNFLKNGKNYPKCKNSKNVQRYAKISDILFDQRSLIHREAIFDHFQTKMFKSETASFHYFSPKNSESLNILDIRLREVGAKRPLNGTSKVNRQTHKHTYGHFELQKASAQRADALKNLAILFKEKLVREDLVPELKLSSCSTYYPWYEDGKQQINYLKTLQLLYFITLKLIPQKGQTIN